MAASTFEVEGLAEQVKQLRAMMSDDPGFRKRVNNVIRQVLKEARNEISQDAAGILDNDPRKAYKAVRSAVYKRILGGQVNILARKKAGSAGSYVKPRKGLPLRGGNRWGRSKRTIKMEGYEGMDRGFVLRFFNAGTFDRAIRSYTDKSGEKHDLGSGSVSHLLTNRSGKIVGHAVGGNRGQIAPRNWFSASSHKALERASVQIQDLIDRIIAKDFV